MHGGECSEEAEEGVRREDSHSSSTLDTLGLHKLTCLSQSCLLSLPLYPVSFPPTHPPTYPFIYPIYPIFHLTSSPSAFPSLQPSIYLVNQSSPSSIYPLIHIFSHPSPIHSLNPHSFIHFPIHSPIPHQFPHLIYLIHSPTHPNVHPFPLYPSEEYFFSTGEAHQPTCRA